MAFHLLLVSLIGIQIAHVTMQGPVPERMPFWARPPPQQMPSWGDQHPEHDRKPELYGNGHEPELYGHDAKPELFEHPHPELAGKDHDEDKGDKEDEEWREHLWRWVSSKLCLL